MKCIYYSLCHPLHIFPLKSLLCMCYNEEIIVEITICLSNVLDLYPSIANNKKRIQNEDVIGMLKIQELSIMSNNVK